MLTILIVDDEEIIRKGLHTTIDWNRYGCDVIGEAENGLQALKFIEELSPDIVITDIRMASYNGLQLIQDIKRSKPNMEIIIISGYSYFKYAKTAMEYGVSAYLLKPIKNSELIDAVNTCREKILMHRKTERALKTYRFTQNTGFFAALLKEMPLTEEKIRRCCATYEQYLPSGRFIVCLLLADDKKEAAALYRAAEHCAQESDEQVFVYMQEPGRLALLIFQKQFPSSLAEHPLLTSIAAQFSKPPGSGTYSAGISMVFHNIKMLHRAYRQAEEALDQRLLFGTGKRYEFKESISVSFETIQKETTEVVRLLSEKNYDKAMQLVRANTYALSKPNMQNKISEYYSLLEKGIGQQVVPLPELQAVIFGRMLEPHEKQKPIADSTDLQQRVQKLITDLKAHDDMLQIINYHPLVQKTMLIIFHEYATPLNIKQVAERLYISTSYLMKLFKEETGKTFVDTLTSYRLKQAILLLQEGQKKIYEISIAVGFQNTKYFTKLLKKYTGHVPSYYYRAKN